MSIVSNPTLMTNMYADDWYSEGSVVIDALKILERAYDRRDRFGNEEVVGFNEAKSDHAKSIEEISDALYRRGYDEMWNLVRVPALAQTSSAGVRSYLVRTEDVVFALIDRMEMMRASVALDDERPLFDDEISALQRMICAAPLELIGGVLAFDASVVSDAIDTLYDTDVVLHFPWYGTEIEWKFKKRDASEEELAGLSADRLSRMLNSVGLPMRVGDGGSVVLDMNSKRGNGGEFDERLSKGVFGVRLDEREKHKLFCALSAISHLSEAGCFLEWKGSDGMSYERWSITSDEVRKKTERDIPRMSEPVV